MSKGCVKPSVLEDLAQLASGYSRPSLATSMVVNPEGYYTKMRDRQLEETVVREAAPRSFEIETQEGVIL